MLFFARIKKKNLGVSTQSILTEYFGLTEEQAQLEVEKARQESADAFAESFGMTRNSLFGGGNKPNSNENDEDEESSEDDEEKLKKNKSSEE